MNPKDLKKLVKACRDLGVLSYKTPEIEFTLSSEAPVKNNTKAKTQSPTYESVSAQFESDALEGDALLFWSTADTADQEQESL